MTQHIHFSRERHIGRVILDRSEALNALSFPMIKALYKQLIAWKKDPSVHAVLVEAKHDKIFCAGGDVRWVYEQRHNPNSQVMDFFWHEYRLNALIASYGKPYIALLNGVTMGGGVGISLHGSYPIATEKFVFAMPETAIGLFPDVGASYLLSRLPPGLGTYLGLTGCRLSAADARDVGLVKYIIPESSIPDVVENIINTDLSTHLGLEIDKCIDAVRVEPGLLSGMDKDIPPLITRCFTKQTVEAIFSALQEVKHPWTQATLHLLQQCSPLSLKVTLMQLQKAATLDLHQCLQMDEVLVQHFLQGNDFYEGIRARLIDKDKTPHWEPSSLEAVSDEMVKGYFHKTFI